AKRREGRKAMRVDQDLGAVLALAQRFKGHTRGAFELAVEPLMRAWGFHRRRAREPSPAEIAEAREAVGSAVIELDGDRARLPNAHTQLDFGGIGVGYGIARALAVLRARRIGRAFLDVSGDCGDRRPARGEGVARGDRRPRSAAWRHRGDAVARGRDRATDSAGSAPGPRHGRARAPA